MNFPLLMPALITPFDSDGVVDIGSHVHNLERLHGLGLSGFLIGGSTGEGPMLEVGERRLLASTARDLLGPGCHIIVGIVAESVRQAMSQIEEAEGAGANTVLVLSPLTLARDRHEVQGRFFTEVADRTKLPVLLYSVPRNTGFSLDERLIAEVSLHEKVVGIKDSGGDPDRIGRIVASTPPDFATFCGATAAVLESVTAGARGAITASANYMPREMTELVELSIRRDPGGPGLQTRLAEAARHVEAAGVPGVKAAAGEIGLRAGAPRVPFLPVSPAWSADLRRRLPTILSSASDDLGDLALPHRDR